MSDDKSWFPFGFGPVLASHRLFCLPFAGGGASFFLPWRKTLAEVALVPIQYPGRETRLSEPCYLDLSQLVDALAHALMPHLDRPYSLLGYSLGAKIGFALCHRLAELGAPLPELFIPTAHAAPGVNPTLPGLENMPDAEFCAHIIRYGGVPENVFQDPELVALLLPILRADIGLVAHAVPMQALDCPILACVGSDDAAARPSGMAEWRRFTNDEFTLRTFQGGHFFARTDGDYLSVLAAEIAAIAKKSEESVRVA